MQLLRVVLVMVGVVASGPHRRTRSSAVMTCDKVRRVIRLDEMG